MRLTKVPLETFNCLRRDVSSETDAASGSIGVLVVIGVRLFREELASLLTKQPGIVVKAVAGDQANALAKAQVLSPDIIILDTGLPNAPDTVRALLLVAPMSHVIALAVTETDAEVTSYAKAGVSGYVTREGSFDDLIAAVRGVANGEFTCSPRITALLLRQVAEAASRAGSNPGLLTARELQIAELINSGSSNKEIASRLKIEVSTVKTHVHHMLGKLGATGRGQAAAQVRPILRSQHPRM